MPISLSVLTQAEREDLYGRALDLLERVGIRFGSAKAIAVLADAGCTVDRDALSAKIPRGVVEKALKTAPSRFLLAGRDPKRDIDCGGGRTYVTAPGQAPWIRDLATRERRAATQDDFIACARLVNGIEEFDQWDYMLVPGDVPAQMMDLRCLQLSLAYSQKPILGWVGDPEAVPFALEMVEAVAGGRAAFRQRPLFSAYISPISPLDNDGPRVDALLAWASYRPPIHMLFIPLPGLTAPITLAGTILQETAAFLGNLSLYQLVEPGWPVIWGCAAGSVDMRSMLACQGPEKDLISVALVEMAKFFEVPCSGLGLTTDAKDFGFQAGMDAASSGALLQLAGADGIWGGSMDSSHLVDPAYLVLVAEAVRRIRRQSQGVTFDDEHLLADVIEEAMAGGQFMDHSSTALHYRTEHLTRDSLTAKSYDAWASDGVSDEDWAVAEACRILDEHQADAPDPALAAELERIATAATKALT